MSFSNARCNLNVCLLGCKVIMRAEFYLEAYLSWLNHLIWALMRVTLSVDGTLPINSWNSISSHGSNPWMHDASCSASWNASRSGVRWKARQNALEFLPEIVVEPGIEEYVVAGGWHGYRVSQKAENPFNKRKKMDLNQLKGTMRKVINWQAKIVVFPPGHSVFGVEVVEQVDEIEGHPGGSKNCHHGNQHAIGATFTFTIQFLSAATPQTDFSFFTAAVSQFERHLLGSHLLLL